MPKTAAYVVGIDLGTTNSALAYIALDEGPPTARILPVPQLVAPGSIEARPLLPSFLYVPTPQEQASPEFRFPGDETATVVGEFARRRGSEVPERLVASAKSWLCVEGIDRESPQLPWGASDEVAKLSPVEASARYLQHLRRAWDKHFPEAPLADQEVLVGVPASFDPVARELTMKAAQLAGLERVTLLEEPQAAFYAWLERQGDSWREQVKAGDLILVCDIGGGTTDFTLIQASDAQGQLALQRIAVGDHILLGGDNMDLALAHALREQLRQEGTTLDSWQFRALVSSCREAKETLLRPSEGATKSVPISILGRGRKLIGGTLRTELTLQLVEEVLTAGFFPLCDADAEPIETPTASLLEWGLPYAADPAITKHLAAFLRSARTTAGTRVGAPTAVLFHGGVLQAPALRERLRAALQQWFPETAGPRELPDPDFEYAVARGAAFYGYVRAHGGVRIRGGVAHAYYLGIAAALPAVPGMEPPLKALCVVPRGLEEGTEVDLPQREFALVVGRDAEFRFFQSATRTDPAGTLAGELGPEFQELPPVRVRLEWDGAQGQRVPVHVRAQVDELGTLQLWFVHRDGQKRWKLNFDLRARERRSPSSS